MPKLKINTYFARGSAYHPARLAVILLYIRELTADVNLTIVQYYIIW